MKKSTLFVLSVIVLCLGLSGSQAYGQAQQAWVARYNGVTDMDDNSQAVATDANGNCYVTGWSQWGTGDSDYITLKYDKNGNQLWYARYDGPSVAWDQAFDIAVDASANVYVTGASDGYSGDGPDLATVKYDTNGIELWSSRYNGAGDPGGAGDWGEAIAVDGAGNVYVTGGSVGSGQPYSQTDYVTIKYNSSGIQQWVARYDGPNNSDDYAWDIVVDGSGNVYVTGQSHGTGWQYDYATIKYNSSGAQQWVARYDGLTGLDDWATSLSVDGSGNVYVTGTSLWSGSDSDYITIMYDSGGNQVWEARYDGPNLQADDAADLILDTDGNVIVTGTSVGDGTNNDYATVKYNSSGVQQWAARYDGPTYMSTDLASAVSVDGVGNVYGTGESDGNGKDYATVKYDSNGNQKWVKIYDDGSEGGVDIAVDGLGNVFVTGSSFGSSGSNYDYLTVKYRQNPLIHKVPGLLE